MKVRLGVIEFIGYREWTESLGNDREWLIQIIQSEVYALAQRRASESGAHVLPMRYDYMILLASNVSEEGMRKILDAVSENSQVPVRMASTCGSTPIEAELNAWKLLSSTEPGRVAYEDCSDEESIVLAHLDIDNVSGMTKEMGTVRTYYLVVDLLHRVALKAERYGSIVQYLGGDNILTVLPAEGYHKVVNELINVNEVMLKAGVGIAYRARDALMLAAEALHEIRSGAQARVIYKHVDDLKHPM